MLREGQAWAAKIKEVEREYAAIRLALDRLFANAQNLGESVKFRDLSRASDHLEDTYLIRLFSEFETGLRTYWNTVKTTHPKTEDLLNSLGGRLKIPNELTRKVHAVREYRNSLVHERKKEIPPVSIGDARHLLCRFLSHLPPVWV